jgi:hypothetical protein
MFKTTIDMIARKIFTSMYSHQTTTLVFNG